MLEQRLQNGDEMMMSMTMPVVRTTNERMKNEMTHNGTPLYTQK
jgi:hypothetical protein